MSKERFRLAIREWNEIHRLPDSWSIERLREVLHQAEFLDPVDDADVSDMAVLVLQDLDVQDAGELVLKVVFGDRMSAGVRQNLVDDLEDDRPWEQFADVSLQAGIFEAMVLLQQVFPNRYGIPDAVHLQLSVAALDKTAAGYLAEASGFPTLLLQTKPCSIGCIRASSSPIGSVRLGISYGSFSIARSLLIQRS